MRTHGLTVIIGLVAVAALVVCTGCGMFTPERNARRVAIMKEDMSHIPDEVDWLLGLDDYSSLYDDTLPPYKFY
jgi:hypothetical protein